MVGLWLKLQVASSLLPLADMRRTELNPNAGDTKTQKGLRNCFKYVILVATERVVVIQIRPMLLPEVSLR